MPTGSGVPSASGDPDPDHASGRLQTAEPARDEVRRRRLLVVRTDLDPRRDLGRAERTEQAQQVGHALGAPEPALRSRPLELGLGAGEGCRVEQVPQRRPLAAAEQFGEQAGVEREGRGPTLGQRCVALVQELRDVPEEQAAGERRGLRRLDLEELDRP
jgi:hypothetical protein